MKINRPMINQRIIELEDKIREITYKQKGQGSKLDQVILMHQYRAQTEALRTILNAIEE